MLSFMILSSWVVIFISIVYLFKVKNYYARVVFFLIILFVGFISFYLMGGGGRKDFSIKKDIGIVMKNNRPCFYIDDEIEDIEKHKVTSISVHYTDNQVNPPVTNVTWFTSKGMNRIPFSMMDSKDKCIIYGDEKLTDEQNKSQELKENTLYSVGFETNSTNVGVVGFSFYKLFKLHKSNFSGKMLVEIVDN